MYCTVQYMLLLKYAHPIMASIVIPHGITDIVHAKTNGRLNELAQIYTGTTITSLILHPLSTNVHPIFVIASIIHFRHDVPIAQPIWKYIITSILVTLFYCPGGFELFLLYMCTVHVPNHYKSAWNYMKMDIRTSIALVISVRIALELFMKTQHIIMCHFAFPVFVQFIAIAHIIYTELYITSSTEPNTLYVK